MKGQGDEITIGAQVHKSPVGTLVINAPEVVGSCTLNLEIIVLVPPSSRFVISFLFLPLLRLFSFLNFFK